MYLIGSGSTSQHKTCSTLTSVAAVEEASCSVDDVSKFIIFWLSCAAVIKPIKPESGVLVLEHLPNPFQVSPTPPPMYANCPPVAVLLSATAMKVPTFLAPSNGTPPTVGSDGHNVDNAQVV